jgi:hypothetical protein
MTDQELLLWILIPLIVIIGILAVECLSPKWHEIVVNAWLIVVIYASIV